MIDIVQKIDEWTTAWLTANYPSATKNLFGYCELMKKTTSGQNSSSEQPMPVKIIDGQADRGTNQVSLDDRYHLITWIRLTDGPGRVQNDEDNWGINEGRRKSATLRMIVAHKVSLGENFINEFIRAFPDRFSINGYQFVYVDDEIAVDSNHETIYETELGKTVYERHRFDWNIYALELNVEFILCEA